MEMLIPLGAIFGAILIGAISPGPSFVLVARTAIAVSRPAGMATAVGIGLGGLMFAGAALLTHTRSHGAASAVTGMIWLSPAGGRWTGTKLRDG